MRRQPFGRLAPAQPAHLLPQRNGRARVVAGARSELDAEAIGLGLLSARMGQAERNVHDGVGQLVFEIDSGQDAQHLHPELLRHLLAGAFAPVLAQRVPDLVPHHGCELIVGEVQLAHEPRVDRDLAAGHAPRVDLLRADDIDFPFPARCVAAECPGAGNEPVRDSAHPCDLGRIVVELVFLASIREYLGVGFGGAAIHLGGRDQSRHALPALDADRPALGRLHRLASAKRRKGQRPEPHPGFHGLAPFFRPAGTQVHDPYNAAFCATVPDPMSRVPRSVFFLLFTVSGFAGLIYESIWSHYLKLFLGHAAYAQTLVLGLFMGGMAIGSWLCSRWSAGWGNLLRGYAVAEGLIGIAALAFHPVFVAATDAAYANILPALGGEIPATLFKWTLAGLLILPQSVLLGMTFPLMSAGLIRRYPTAPGESLAMLYFTNSLGASIGVLASGFLMIEKLGLPGTVQSAGALNLALAAAVWLLARGTEEPVRARPGAGRDSGGAAPFRFFLAVALLTGAASFVFEIGWIRMLSLVLGSSTHSFELMLSAFILGLACGGYWVRRRIDSIADPVRFLGIVLVTMGLLALATLPLYGQMFGLMKGVMNALAKTETGYTLFLFSSHGIALAIMFPATFCAGITLPLITYALLRGGHGERSIGAVYSANTLGSILGVFSAAHLGMPFLGLKGLIAAGAALDEGLGLVLLWRAAGGPRFRLGAAALSLPSFPPVPAVLQAA